MKNLITQIACTMLLMAFIMSFASIQMSDIKILQLIQTVKNENDETTSFNAEKLANIAGCSKDEVVLFSEHGKEYVEIPVYDIIRPETFWGIEKEKNKIVLKIEKEMSQVE